MKFQKQILTILLSLFFLFSCQTDQNTRIEEIKSTGKSIIPDTRVEIFDVTEKNDTIFVKTSSKEAFDKIKSLENANLQVAFLPCKKMEKQYGVVNLSACNIRSKTSHGAEMLTQGNLGMPVKIYEENHSWYRIQTPDDYIGWVDDYGVTPMTEKEWKTWKNAPKVIFTDFSGFVYKDADCQGDIVSDIVLGNILKLVESQDNFYKVEFPDKRTGYLKKSQSNEFENWYNSIELTQANVVSLAKKFMGIPYLWGGTSFKAIDCSGFMKTVYRMHGIILQRDASQQALYGEEISLDNDYQDLQPGDLLLFGGKRITHVGMYIGNKEFIHEAGRVKINSLDENAENFSGYRKKSLKVARRIIGSVDTPGISTFKTNKYYN